MGTVRSAGVLAMEAREVLAALTGSDLTGLTDGEITELVVLTSEVTKLAEAAHVAAASRLDVSGAWQGSGARSAAAWVGWECHQSPARSGAALTCARLLRDLPSTELAFLAGRLTVDHVRLLARARRANPEAFSADETRLVGLAEQLLFRRFQLRRARRALRDRPHRALRSGRAHRPGQRPLLLPLPPPLAPPTTPAGSLTRLTGPR